MTAPAMSTRRAATTGARAPMRGRLVVTARDGGDPVGRGTGQRHLPTH
jgi:hypothetical protein